MPHRGQIAEAELWGTHLDLQVANGLVIRQMVGRYGTVYQVEVSSPWVFWRFHAWMTQLPPGASMLVTGECPGDEEFDDDGVLILHYWEDARRYATTGPTGPAAAPFRQSNN